MGRARLVGEGEGSTKDRLIDAAIATLREEGFAGASARAIADRGGLNQALIFYHFGTVNGLLLAALDRTSEDRMRAYRAAIEGAEGLAQLATVAGRVFREDLRSGHVKVMAELIAGTSAHPELGPEISRRIEPWIELSREVGERVCRGTGLEQVLPPEDIAFAVVSLFLGIELTTHLDGDTARAERLFETAGGIAGLFEGLLDLGGSPKETGTDDPAGRRIR
jgi:AcrR family transcriptional regulator